MPERIQLSRAKGWRMPANTIKVSRPSKWGNPFNATQVCVPFYCGAAGPGIPLVGLRAKPSLDRCIDLYVGWLRGQMDRDREFLAPLRGRNLGCWCALDQPCHADVLLRLANGGDHG